MGDHGLIRWRRPGGRRKATAKRLQNWELRYGLDLIHQTLLNVDAAGTGSRQIANQLFVWRWVLKRILRYNVEKTLRLWFEI